MRRDKHLTVSSGKEGNSKPPRTGPRAQGALPKARPYRLKPVSLGGARPGYDLTKALQLAGHLEDEGIAGKLQLRKQFW